MFLPSNITLKFGDAGDFVTELQRRLVAVGAHQEDAVSGAFDGATVNSVSSFQSRSGLRADGIAGPETLRKLNGVVTGDTSTNNSSSGNQEEEEAKRLAQENLTRATLMTAEHEAQQSVYLGPQTEAVASDVYHGTEVYQPAAQPQQELHAQSAMNDQQMLQQQIQREAMLHQQNAQASPSDMLAQMLLQQTAQATKGAEPQHTPQHAPQQQAPQHTPQPAHQPVAQAAAPQAHETPAAAPEQAKGIVGRALQKMDAMLQKMSDYFEAKLPPDVLREVKNLGTTMLQSGVKEVAIPAGPEQVRGPTGPARGPEQQAQIPTRG